MYCGKTIRYADCRCKEHRGRKLRYTPRAAQDTTPNTSRLVAHNRAYAGPILRREIVSPPSLDRLKLIKMLLLGRCSGQTNITMMCQ